MTDAHATFGSGGAEPYAKALRRDEEVLFIQDVTETCDAPRPMNLLRWNEEADGTDFALLATVDGPLLDVGCGPGRMVKAAVSLGIPALGIDVAPVAVDIARGCGLPVLTRSVFDRLPSEGAWSTLLLIDGNVGIGGDVAALLTRCAALVGADGAIIVEVHENPSTDREYVGTVLDAVGHESDSFPWADIGLDALRTRLAPAGLVLDHDWEDRGRVFCRLKRG